MVTRIFAWGSAFLFLCAVDVSADPLFTFGFNDLNGSYTSMGSAGTLTVEPSAISIGGPFNSSGDVTRVLTPEGTADYDAGFVALANMADFQVTMDISNVSANSADAVGTFMVMDTTGDQLTGEISGSWTLLGTFGSFVGLTSNVQFSESSGDGRFNGPGGGSFDLDSLVGSVYEGTLLGLETGSWFTSSFDDTDFQITASFTPEPAILLTMLVGAAVMFPRRR